MLAITEVGLTNTPSQQSSSKLEFWRAVCKTHRKELDKVLTLTWIKIPWQERKTVSISGGAYLKHNLESLGRVHNIEQARIDRGKIDRKRNRAQ